MADAQNLADLAWRFALVKHRGHVDASGAPYHQHLSRVGLAVEHRGPRYLALAYLHDVLEDTETTYDELASTFDSWLASCVKELSREDEEESYEEYINRLRNHHLPAEIRHVKIADLLDNLRGLGDGGLLSLQRRYVRALRVLTRTV